MYKVVILGCENSHANTFLDLIANGEFPGTQVVGIYSDEDENAEKLCAQFGVKRMAAYDEAVGEVDGVIITARHGANHYKYAKPYISSGVPMFIDKPITVEPDEAVEFMREAKENGVRLCGGSVLPLTQDAKDFFARISAREDNLFGGNLVCPLHSNDKYGGFYFYSQHLVQLMTSIFGSDVESVFARRNSPDNVHFIANYRDFSVTATYGPMNYYIVDAYCDKGAERVQISFRSEDWHAELAEFYHLLKGGEMEVSYDEFINPVFIMNAIEQSFITGSTVKVARKSV